MEQINKCLSPDLHGLLYKFVYKYIEDKHDNFENFGQRFFDNAVQTGQKPPPTNASTRKAVQMLSADPAALYKLVECDPNILFLRDKLKFLVLGYLMNSPVTNELAEYGLEYFNCAAEDDIEDANSAARRTGVAQFEAYDPEKEPDVQIAYYEKSPEELEKLREKIRHALLFRSLDESQMNDILGAMFRLDVPKDSYVIKQGDDGDYFYVIDDGIFEAYVKGEDGVDQKVSTYRGNGSFGELALLYNMPRVATVKAVTNSSLWCLDRDSFRKIVVQSAFKKRKEYEKLIASVPMLKELSDYERQQLADALQPMTFEDGECVIRQSEEATGMYFVEEGTIIFSHIDDNGRVTKLSKIVKGGYFGELALVTKKARAVSAYAAGPVRLAFADKEAFERLLGPCKEIMKRNIALYNEKLSSGSWSEKGSKM